MAPRHGTLDEHLDLLLGVERFEPAADFVAGARVTCLDRHVEYGRGDQIAFHWHGGEGEYRALTYSGPLADVQRLANGLLERGAHMGDIVAIFLPMTEAVVAMLASARIGAPHTVVFGESAPPRPWWPNPWRRRTPGHSSPSMAPAAKARPQQSNHGDRPKSGAVTWTG